MRYTFIPSFPLPEKSWPKILVFRCVKQAEKKLAAVTKSNGSSMMD